VPSDVDGSVEIKGVTVFNCVPESWRCGGINRVTLTAVAETIAMLRPYRSYSLNYNGMRNVKHIGNTITA
jgi:hypothetical protein